MSFINEEDDVAFVVAVLVVALVMICVILAAQ